MRRGLQDPRAVPAAHPLLAIQLREPRFNLLPWFRFLLAQTSCNLQDVNATLSNWTRVVAVDEACEGPGLGSMLRALGPGGISQLGSSLGSRNSSEQSVSYLSGPCGVGVLLIGTAFRAVTAHETAAQASGTSPLRRSRARYRWESKTQTRPSCNVEPFPLERKPVPEAARTLQSATPKHTSTLLH